MKWLEVLGFELRFAKGVFGGVGVVGGSDTLQEQGKEGA